jgi:hypothetical protein
MKLSDVMSHANLALYPEVALVIFLAVFALICARVFLFTPKRDFEAAAAIPLSGDDPVTPRTSKQEERS